MAPDDIGAEASKAESLLGKIGTFSKSVAVSGVENVNSLLPKVTDALSDVGTASVTFAKTFGKTFAEESGKYANTCFDVLGALGAGVKITRKDTIVEKIFGVGVIISALKLSEKFVKIPVNIVNPYIEIGILQQVKNQYISSTKKLFLEILKEEILQEKL